MTVDKKPVFFLQNVLKLIYGNVRKGRWGMRIDEMGGEARDRQAWIYTWAHWAIVRAPGRQGAP